MCKAVSITEQEHLSSGFIACVADELNEDFVVRPAATQASGLIEF